MLRRCLLVRIFLSNRSLEFVEQAFRDSGRLQLLLRLLFRNLQSLLIVVVLPKYHRQLDFELVQRLL